MDFMNSSAFDEMVEDLRDKPLPYSKAERIRVIQMLSDYLSKMESRGKNEIVQRRNKLTREMVDSFCMSVLELKLSDCK
jgi:hypothetical protein